METRVRFLGREDPLDKEMATHPSILAWRIPWTEEPGGLQSMRSQSQTRLKRLSTAHNVTWGISNIFSYFHNKENKYKSKFIFLKMVFSNYV